MDSIHSDSDLHLQLNPHCLPLLSKLASSEYRENDDKTNSAITLARSIWYGLDAAESQRATGYETNKNKHVEFNINRNTH